MFGPRGNPQARNLFGVIVYLQRQAGWSFGWWRGGGERIQANAKMLRSHNAKPDVDVHGWYLASSLTMAGRNRGK